MAKRQVSVLDCCVSKLGVHKGAVAAANVAQLAIATNELGHFPTALEYADYWAVDERSAWRHRARGRDVFGEDLQDVVELVAARIQSRSYHAVMSLPVPRTAAA
jgi:hypothetical protein